MAIGNAENKELEHFGDSEINGNALGLPPPFWAFAWAGGQALARHILDHPWLVAGKSVADFASGSGLVAIASAKAGARSVLAIDIDPWAETAIRLNGAINGVTIETTSADLIGTSLEVDVVVAGDVFYDRDFADRLTIWFARLAEEGRNVMVGDPGRAYCPKSAMEVLSIYQVPVTRALEDSDFKETTIWRFIG